MSIPVLEAMGWETVRHLERMEPLVVLIRNLAVQGNAPQEVLEELSLFSPDFYTKSR